MGLAMLDTFHARKGDEFLHADQGAVWARLVGAGLDQKFSGPVTPAFNGTLGMVQLGSDLYVSEDGQNITGPLASYAHASGDVHGTILAEANTLAGNLSTDAYSVGAYFTHIAKEDGQDKWYLDGVLMGSWYRNTALSQRLISTHINGSGINASLEGGYNFKLDEQWTLEPMAQIIYSTMSFDGTSDSFSTLDFQPGDAWTGRIGARLEDCSTLYGSPITPFVELNFWHGFGGTDTVVYNSSIPLSSSFGNSDIEVATGLSARLDPSSSLYTRLSYLTSFAGNYLQTLKGQIGFRYAW
jgi:outer membrane autotransporter protein